jgi:L-fuconolactonase
MIIDAHQHVWDLSRARYDWLGPELSPINRTITQDEVLPALRRVGVDGVVLVQAADNREDTDYLLEVAHAFRQVVAVVGFVPLEQPARVAEELPALKANPLVVGIRNLIHEQPDPDFLLRPDVNESLGLLAASGMTFDLVSALPRHLQHVPELSERHPELRMVIDHLSRPPIGASSVQPWWQLIARAAANPQVFAKVSGLYPDADRTAWSTDAIRPFFDRALEVFGSKRLMYGGDWPISILAGGYDHVWQGLQPLFAGLSSAERSHLLCDTALRCYVPAAERLEALRSAQVAPDPPNR